MYLFPTLNKFYMLLLSKCMSKVNNKYKYLYCWFQTGTYPLVAFTLAFLIIANFEPTLHKKWSFPLRIPSANVDLFTFTEEILNEKLHFLYSATRGNRNWVNNLKEKQPISFKDDQVRTYSEAATRGVL